MYLSVNPACLCLFQFFSLNYIKTISSFVFISCCILHFYDLLMIYNYQSCKLFIFISPYFTLIVFTLNPRFYENYQFFFIICGPFTNFAVSINRNYQFFVCDFCIKNVTFKLLVFLYLFIFIHSQNSFIR